MKREWTTQPVGDLRAKTKYALTGGPFGSNLVSCDYTDEGVPVIRGCNLPDNASFAFDDLVFVSEKKADALRPNNAFPGDLIFTQRGTLGQVGLIPKNSPFKRFVISQSQMKLAVDPDKADALYLYHYFRLPSTVEAIQGLAISSGVPHINLDILRKFQVITPPVCIQRKIAAILSAYGEMIENNKRRIALLEKMAEEIYREWFVRLRFPGHEKVSFVKGVPEGWMPVPSNKVFRVMSGGTPNTDNPAYWDGDIPFFTPKDSGDGFYVLKTERAITQKGLDSCNSRLYRKDTIFITARGTVGKICLAHRDMAMNQTCYALSPKEEGDSYFHFLSMKNAIAYIKGISKSGVFDNIIVDTFKIIPIFMPPASLIVQFNEYAGPIFKQIGALLESNELLIKTRDALLPRLISGKLSVENLDIQFPPGMAEEAEAIA
jgi:type I restriction enzyme S subunit